MYRILGGYSESNAKVVLKRTSFITLPGILTAICPPQRNAYFFGEQSSHFFAVRQIWTIEKTVTKLFLGTY